MHTRGRRLSGFTFGRGAIVARIYDKTLELAVRGETWPSMASGATLGVTPGLRDGLLDMIKVSMEEIAGR